MVVSKPGGLLVHRSREAARDKVFLLQQVRDQLGGDWLYPVHRLDRAASGLVVFGRSSDAARRIQAALASDTTIKEYLAVVNGIPPAQMEIDRPLTNKETRRKQEARTDFVRVARMQSETDPPLAMVRARLHTGRRHQIRRHLARTGHFILGDTTYGKGKINRHFRQAYGLPRMCLHATRLVFVHPDSGEPFELIDPLPEDLRGFLCLLPGLADSALDCM